MVDVISPPKKLTKVCYSCGAELAYTQPEVKSKTVSDYTGDRDTYHFIKCPACNNDVNVPAYMPR